jgi:A/G-specific adenine glycosylase
MELGATVCGALAPDCASCPVAGCASRGRVAAGAPPANGAAGRRGGRPARPARRRRFEETDRYVRGRVLAALVAGARAEELVAGRALPEGIAPARVARAIAGLERDGLVVREGATVRLP